MPIDPERWKQIDELFGAALQIGLEERAAFLDKACVEDKELRREVETLLASDRKEQGYIEDSPMKIAADLLVTPPVRLDSGKFIGHYKIVSLLGSGGMGEVYRASDPRIGRDVAIKILPDQFSKDADRLRRFEQEARAAGILNHPNILAIHDTGTYNGSPYLVSELLQGEILQRKLTGQRLPIRKTLDYSLQIAKGLGAAHDKGIVHRDLKPGNIFITKEGRVKILDFGLAKLTHSDTTANQLASGDKLEPLTETGIVLGTVVYMSPEQVSGRKIDHRSDIFAFGAVLYEMLYGNRPFSGPTQIEIMHAILKADPPELSASNSNVPISLERIVRRCLEKDPSDRFQSASDLAFALESMSTTSGTTVATFKQQKSIPIAWILCGIFFLVALIFGTAFYGLKRKDVFEIPASAQRLSIILPENTVLNSSAISPDGHRLAYVTNEMMGPSKLWLRSMDSGDAEEIPGSEDATLPFWSPDSRSVAFFTEHSLKKFTIGGGSIETLCQVDIDDPKGGSWNQHGDILFSPRAGAGLYRIAARGGDPTAVTDLDNSRSEVRDLFPQFLPDGRHFFYIRRAFTGNSAGVYIGSLDSKDTKRILLDQTPVRYVDPGYLLFVRNDTKLMVQQFDKETLALTGDAVPIANDGSDLWSGPEFSLSANNMLVQGGRAGWASRPTWFDRSGTESSPSENYPSALDQSNRYYFCDISSDDRRLLTLRDGVMWMVDLLTGSFVRFGMADARDASFSPDGTHVAYSFFGDKVAVYVRPSSGSGKAELLHQWDFPIKNIAWSADNRFIAFAAVDRTTKYDVWILPLAGERKPFAYLQTKAREEGPVFSPNGKWIAYQSNESGRFEVYVRSFPLEAGGKWQISTDGGEWPVWRRDGKELFYLTADKELTVTQVETGEIFKVGESNSLFQTRAERYINTRGITFFKPYVVSADGSHILVNSLVDNTAQSEITVFLNWQNLLKK